MILCKSVVQNEKNYDGENEIGEEGITYVNIGGYKAPHDSSTITWTDNFKVGVPNYTSFTQSNVLEWYDNEFPYSISTHFEEFKQEGTYDYKFYVIRLSVPGYQKEDLIVGYSGNKLIVSGKGIEQYGVYEFSNIYKGNFKKTFLDRQNNLDFGTLEAELKNGILSLRMERDTRKKENKEKINYIEIK